MHFAAALFLPAAALLASLPLSRAYNYEEIQKWNASCSPKDTCSIPRDLDDSYVHNCDCSSLCSLYDSCCIDSPFLNISKKYERTASCRSSGQSGESVFMIDVCSSNYKSHESIRRKCEQAAKNWSDPFGNVPVTNIKSQKTYRSIFCAICNDENNMRELEMWQVMLDCSALNEYIGMCTENREFVLANMVYIREKGLWGLWSWGSKTDWKFRNLPVSFQITPGLKTHVKECRPKLISECPASWNGTETNHLCHAYMGAVYFDDVAFRNVHCALCNGVTNFANMSCHDTIVTSYRRPTMSFGLLLDFGLRQGDKVGNVETKCDTDEVYDPFSKKCRTLECPLPGFTLKDRKCERV